MVGGLPRFLRLDELRYALLSGLAGCTSFLHNSKEQQRGSGARGGKLRDPPAVSIANYVCLKWSRSNDQKTHEIIFPKLWFSAAPFPY